MVTRKKKSTARRRPSRRRRNPWPNVSKGHAKAARKGWVTRRARLKKAKAKKKPVAKSSKSPKSPSRKRRTRRNPGYSFQPARTRRTYRGRRRVRYNPRGFLRKIGLSRSGIRNAATVGAGLGIGYVGMPLVTRFAPAGMARHRNFFGIVHVLLGGLMFAGGKRASSPLRLMGTTVAGMGIYDLIASNLPLGLPMLPSDLPGGMITDALPAGKGGTGSGGGGVGASYPKWLGANYDPPALMGASYPAPSMKTEGLGAGDLFDGMFE